MRIVLDGRYIQDHFPGIARYTFNLAQALGSLALDDEIVLLVDIGAANDRYDLDRLASHANLVVRPIVAPVFSPVGQVRLSTALRQVRPDVYHTPYFLRSPYAPGPSVLTIFDLIAEHAQPDSKPGLVPRLRRAAFHAAIATALHTSTRVIVPSEATAIDLLHYHRIARRKIDVVPLGADPIFRPADPVAVSELRTRYGLPERFILCVGINKPHKNLGGIVRALRNPEVGNEVLVSAGPIDRRYPAALDLARDNGVESRVRELGDVPSQDLPILYSAASVLVCPSLDEGFGFAPIEAMACGTPVVSSDRSSLPEVVGDAGLLVDATDDRQLAGAVRRILDDRQLASRLSVAGLLRAEELSWRRTASATLAVYREAARAERCP